MRHNISGCLFPGGVWGIKREEQCGVFYYGAQKNHRYAGHKHQHHKKGISIYSEEEKRERQQNKIMIESWII